MRAVTAMGAAWALALGAWASAAGCGGTDGPPPWVKPGVYRGTLGTQAVTLGIRREGTGLGGGYFYERRKVNLSLTLGRRGETLVAQEEVWSGPGAGLRVTGCLALSPAGAGLRGEWRRPDGGHSLPVTLAPLDVTRLPLNLPDSPGLRSLRTSDPLAFLRLNRPWVPARDGTSVREPLSGLVYPRVPGGSAALNAALQDRQLLHAANALDCRSALGDAPAEGDGYALEARITFRSPQLLSVSENAGYFCGGAHPDAFDVGLILDRASGREVAVRALWPGLTPARLTGLYLARAGADAECREVVRDREPTFTASLTPAGLAVTPTALPHVVFVCAQTVTLPYASLRTWADPGGRYFRDLYPR
jgi:hypothetical protein